MLPTYHHHINNRTLTTHHSIEEELNLDHTKNYLFDLSSHAILDLEGDKAGDFLQGQVTCDVRAVSHTTMIQGAQCNLKGRIMALMDIIDWHGLKLILQDDLAEFVHPSLVKTALLSRVSIQKNTTLKVYGFYLQNPENILPFAKILPTETFALTSGPNYCCYHLGQGFYIFLIDKAHESALSQPFIDQDQLLGSLTWHTMMIEQHHITIYPESRGLFLPHRLGLHQTTAVSFNKGCYKGQEIIARMHFKSTIKHELKLFQIKTKATLYSGQKVMAISGANEIGELVDYSSLGEDQWLVAISLLKDASLQVLFEKHLEAIELVAV